MDDLNELSRYLDASAWFGVGVLGVLLFLLGVYQPALSGLPYAAYLRVVVAIAGGAVAVLGFSFGYDRREYELRHPRRPAPGKRAKEIEIAPSLEVYDPKAARDEPSFDDPARPQLPGPR
jgi:hypothetical protein